MAFIDPHRTTVPSSDASPAGAKKKLSKVLKHAGHASTFHGIFGVDKTKAEYNGTLFRFPLRKSNNQSKIKSNSVTTEEIKDTLFESFKAEASYMLLFMKNIVKVSLFEWNQNLNKAEELFSVAIKKDAISDILREKSLFCKEQSSTTSSSKVLIQLYDVAVRSREFYTSDENITYWLILNVLGKVGSTSGKIPSFPSVGLACQIPAVGINQSHSSSIFPDNLSAIADSLWKSVAGSQSMAFLPRKQEGPLNGSKAFCFLPLPLHTYLPVHVHGSFAVSRNRRSIAWKGVDIRNDDTTWNEDILKSMLAPAYSLLLLIQCRLFRYESPLNSTEPDAYRSAYTFWPVYDEVKNETIWKNLLEPVLSVLTFSKVLWSDASGGQWVSFNDAFFASKGSPKIVVAALLQAGLPVVILPPKIYDTLCQIPCLDKILEERAIKPQHLREKFPKDFRCESKKDLDVLLNFLLCGIDNKNVSEIYGIQLLPLMDGSCCSFANIKYVLPEELQTFYESFMVGTEDMVVDFRVSRDTYKKLKSICAFTKLEMVDFKILFQVLVKISISKWAGQSGLDSGIAWKPGTSGHPSRKWLTDIWDFIRNKNCINVVQGVPIVPVRCKHDVYSLVPLPPKNAGSMLCYISPSIYSQKLASALRKLRFVIVDQMLTCESSLFPFLSLKEFLAMFPTNAVKCVEKLTSQERDALLSFIVKPGDNLNLSPNSISKIRKLPIFSVTDKESKFTYVPLDGSPTCPFLRPKNRIVADLFLPPSVIAEYDDETLQFLSQVNVKTLSLSDFIVDHCIPFAEQLLRNSKFEEGERIIFTVFNYLEINSRWKLKKYQPIINCLKKSEIICNESRKYFCANEMYIQCKEFKILVANFEMHTPSRRYSSFESVLLCLGLKTWSDIQKNRIELVHLLKSVDKELSTKEIMYERSNLLLTELHNPHSVLIDIDKSELADVCCFLGASRPSKYPQSLDWCVDKCTTKRNFFKIADILPWSSQAEILVGSVVPIASKKYKINSTYFRSLNAGDVENQLKYMQSKAFLSVDITEITSMIRQIYAYLMSSNESLRLKVLWAPFVNPPAFISTDKCIEDIPFDMQPFYYKFPVEYNSKLFDVKPVIDAECCKSVLNQLHGGNSNDIIEHEKMILEIIHWVYDKKCTVDKEEMLLLSKKDSLECASSLVYDDREWSSKSSNEGQLASIIKNKSIKFVHHKIPSSLAQYFHVKPFSDFIAPSARLKFDYVKTGQHESITNRISKIVDDYDAIDIFKELIQNADDAGAKEVKFLIDWRQHPCSSLFADEMKDWQGPALLAYNDAVFTESDMENICKVAGETKKSDPTKIGRFGVGFCSTYHLTDVPSFVTGKDLVIFDPHTCYLRSRVSRDDPGMKINLVQSQKDLNFYEHQLAPYDDVFGCNVYNLKDHGFNGTLFRFPFRNDVTSCKSEICSKTIDEEEIDKLVSGLKDFGEELIMFSRNVCKISLYERKAGSNTIEELHSISRSVSNRVNFLGSVLTEKSDCFEVSITIKQTISVTSHWLICSLKGEVQPNEPGFIPLGEIAVKYNKKDHYPQHQSVEGRIFCFLPLPIQSGLNFHINGNFIVSKDRRNISLGEGSAAQWNKDLCLKVIGQCYLNILQCITERANMKKCLLNQRKEFLDSYYYLWNFKSNIVDGVAALVKLSIKSLLPKTNKPLLWSEVQSGQWLSPSKVVIFQKDEKCKPLLDDILQNMLQSNLPLIKAPYHILFLINDNVKKKYNYQNFILEVLLPNINEEQFRESWEMHLLHILKSFNFSVYGPDSDNDIAKKLKSEACIPCQNSEELRHVKDVVDCTNSTIENLFHVSEGRFPVIRILDDAIVKKNMKSLGMSSSTLSVELVVNRAKTVQGMEPVEDALQRSKFITKYIADLNNADEDLKNALSNIPFLPTYKLPQNVSLPCFNEKTLFSSPSELFQYKYRHLLFTVKQISCIKEKIVISRLLVDEQPKTADVVRHLKLVIEATNSQVVDDDTKHYLDGAVKEIYKYFENEKAEDLSQSLQDLDCPILHDRKFISPNNVFYENNFSHPPYLSILPHKFHCFKTLMLQVFKVKKELSLDFMISLLDNINVDFSFTVLPKDLLKFVVNIALCIAQKISDEDLDNIVLYLPDSDGIMRKASSLACDDHKSDYIKKSLVFKNHFEEGFGFFVHGDIPRQKAIALGAYPILDAIMKDCEDDDFMKGEEYSQREDLCVRLNSILSKYPVDASILQEFVQNADDAGASEIIFVLDHRTTHPDKTLFCENPEWKKLQHTPALCIINNRKFSEADIDGIRKLGEGGKQGSTGSIGKFGIGFNVAYHVTDCPSFLSCGANNSPENLCAFDPTRSYVSKQKPGIRWNLLNKEVVELRDQFAPYLFDDIFNDRIELSGKQQFGYVVFRLPLTRMPGNECKHLNDQTFEKTQLKEILLKYGTLSEEVLLFLNHVKTIKCLEIAQDGSISQLFRVSSAVPDEFTNDCEIFSYQCDSYKKAVQNNSLRQVSLFHRLDVELVSACQEKKRSWLVQKILFGKFSEKYLQSASKHNLCAVGAVAIPRDITTIAQLKGKLFCYLPLPINTMLPVHIHGHFITDDSRKHLESFKVEDSGWNRTLLEKLICPAYVELISHVKCFLLSRDEPNDVVAAFLYKLFPAYIESDSRSEHSNAFVQSIVSSYVYEHLSTSQEPFFWLPDKNCWFPLQEIRFGAPNLHYENHFHPLPKALISALSKMGMKIISTARHIPVSLNHLKKPDYWLHQVDVINFLREVNIEETTVCDIIKENLSGFLKYCLQGYKLQRIPSLLRSIPLIQTVDGHLRRLRSDVLHPSRYSKLLPKSSNCILEEDLYSDVLVKLGQVLKPPNLDVLSAEVPLQTSRAGLVLSEEEKNTVLLLWTCLSEDKQYEQEKLNKYFLEKPVLPANDDYFYPMCLSKTLVNLSDGRVSGVLRKLNYKTLNLNNMSITNEQLILNIKELVFSKNEDIAACFLHQEPKPVDLSEDEVFIVMQLLQSCSAENLSSVSEVVRSMRIFLHASGKHYVTVQKNSLIMPEKAPIQGIEVIECKCGVTLLKNPSRNFVGIYENLIPNFSEILLELKYFYSKYVCKCIGSMKVDEKVCHVDFIVNMNGLSLLKDIQFLELGNSLALVRDFYDPDVEFFSVFRENFLPKHQWRNHFRLEYLRKLGLKCNISNEEWIYQAKTLFDSSVSSEVLVKKSKILYTELVKKAANTNEDGGMFQFLKDASEIPFMYCDVEHKGKFNFFRDKFFPSSEEKKTICFKGAVFNEDISLSFHLCHPLPKMCHELKNKPNVIEHLGIVCPLAAEVVVKNLLYLCQSINKHTWTAADSEICSGIYKTVTNHYRFLDSFGEDEALMKLKDKNCIVVKSGVTLKAVKPCHATVQQHSPSSCWEPFCYSLPISLGSYQNFFHHVGVKDRLTASSYSRILHDVERESRGNLKNTTEDIGTLALNAYYLLINILRDDNTLNDCSIPLNLVLISEDHKFLPPDKLVYNDARWYSSRISCSFDYLLPPQPDDKGSRRPPLSLKIKQLSDVVKEELDWNCESNNALCENDELFFQNKRDTQCECAHSIKQTLMSKEFLEGLHRLYYHDHQLPPTSDFKDLVINFQKSGVVCVAIPLKTHLVRENERLPGSDDDSKLCFLSTKNGTFYIHPHFNGFEVRDLLKEVASEINKALGGTLKSEQHITSMFLYQPNEIHQCLTCNRVAEYSPNAIVCFGNSELGIEKKVSFLKEVLVFVNYDTNEKIIYFTPQGSFLHAKVVQDFVYSNRISITKRCIEITTSNDTSVDTSEEQNILVSPLEIFKILTIPQVKKLEERSEQLFCKPVVLAVIPQTVEKTKEWVVQLYNSEDFMMYSKHALEMIKYRIRAQFHYQLQLGNISKEVYAAATFAIVDYSRSTEQLTCASSQNNECVEVTELAELFKGVAIHDSSCPDSDSEDDNISSHSADSTESERSPPASTPTVLLSTAVQSTLQDSSLPSSHSNASRASSTSVAAVVPSTGQATGPLPSTLPSPAPVTKPIGRPASIASRFINISPRTANVNRKMPTSMRFMKPTRVRDKSPPLCKAKARAWLEQATDDFEAAQSILFSGESCKHPALVCFICNDIVMKCLMSLYYTYVDEGHYYSGSINLLQLLDVIKNSNNEDCKSLMKVCDEAAMTVSGYDTKCRLPSTHNPVCAPVAVYTVVDAEDALAVVKKLMCELKTINLLKSMAIIPDVRFRSSLVSSLVAGELCVYWNV